MTPFFARNFVNTGRQTEWDLVKVVAIFEMIFMHLQEIVFSFAYKDARFIDSSYFLIFADNFFYLTGPFSFLFSMGCTMPFSRNQDAGTHMKRGAYLIAGWLALNALRMIPMSFLVEAATGVPAAENFRVYVFANDVLFFAGAFFLLYGLLQKGKLSFAGIAGVFASLFLVAQLAGDFGKFLPPWSWKVLGGFVDIRAVSAFPLLNWGFPVVVGVAFGKLLRRCMDKTKLYAILCVCGATATAVALKLLHAHGALTYEVLRENWVDPLSCHHVNFVSLACALSGLALAVGAGHFLARLFPEKLREAVSRIARRIFPIYFIHWLIVPTLGFSAFLRNGPASVFKIAATALAVYIASFAAASLYGKLKAAYLKRNAI